MPSLATARRSRRSENNSIPGRWATNNWNAIPEQGWGGTMPNMTLTECLQPETVTVERVNYFPRQLLTADDMFADQEYFLLKLRRHNRFLHGWGTVCGLVVTAAPTSDLPWQVQIGAGYALGPYGDEIYVAEPVSLDLASCSAGPTDPCEPG